MILKKPCYKDNFRSVYNSFRQVCKYPVEWSMNSLPLPTAGFLEESDCTLELREHPGNVRHYFST